jgi:hypothetical protein
MSGPIRIDDAVVDRDPPLIDPDRTIGDTAELVPGNAPGERGRPRGIIRTRGGDEQAQLLTVTIAGSGVFDSSLTPASTAPRGPIVALVEWGIRGGRARAELDIPQGGIVFSLVASYVQVSARYDGLLLVNGKQLDPEATGAPNPRPKQRVGAMVGYGSYGPTTRLTRTFRLDDIPGEIIPAPGGGIPVPLPTVSPRIAVPNFARRVEVMGLGIDAVGYRVRIGTFDPDVEIDTLFEAGTPPRPVDLPGDAVFVEIENLGPEVLANPTLVFDIGL